MNKLMHRPQKGGKGSQKGATGLTGLEIAVLITTFILVAAVVSVAAVSTGPLGGG